jgi:predicted transcriptional regulator
MRPEQKLEALRKDIDSGLDDLDNGRVVDGETVFAELKLRFAVSRQEKQDDRLP